MCGIAGFLNVDGIESASILARLAHRGPDGEGSAEIAPGSRLLHTRLSIIDLSDAGRQPMRDPRTGNVIVFNGEIYNFRDLRRELDDGEEWASHSDTEVILRAWRRWGLDSLPKLRGMFAFALWDATSRELFLARDRFGIKPLYFARRGKSFAFASEMRALLATGIVDGRVDPARVGEYLRFQSSVGTGCLVEGVEMLEAGGWLRVSEEGEVRSGSWVEEGSGDGLPPAGSRRNSRQGAGAPFGAGAVRGDADGGRRRDAFATGDAGATKDVAASVADAFDEAVRLHLESDVPVGAFLSGGLDSAAIVGTMARLGVTPKTFTVCFGESDESVAARVTASFVGSEHHEVTLSSAEVLAMVPEAVASMDSPSADGINSYVVSRAVRAQGLKVALSGLGGDELFGGYPSFTRARALSSRLLLATPRPLRAALGVALSAGAGWSTTLAKAGDALAMPGTLTDLYLESRALFSRAQVERLTGAPTGEHPMRDRLLALEQSTPDRPLTFISIAEMTTYMRDTLLRDTDQMSMANGLEVRVPFLDGPFADCLLGLSDEAKFGDIGGIGDISNFEFRNANLTSKAGGISNFGFRNANLTSKAGAGGDRTSGGANSKFEIRNSKFVSKPLLVAAFGDRIPAVLHGLPKKGFSLPMRQWMRGPLREYCLDRLMSTALRDAGIDGAAAMAVWKAFEDDRARWSRPWALVVLADWSERNL